MKILRLKLYQETACYKKPFAFKVGETYPLPPYSTVKGMFHSILEAKEFIPMRISIQGNYDTMMIDYQTFYFFKKTDVAEFPLVLDGLAERPNFDNDKMTKMPIYSHMLYDINLIIHVAAEEQVLGQIVTQIETRGQHLSLGRWEDLVRVDEYKEVEAVPLDEWEEVELENDAYIPLSVMPSTCDYIPYKLNWKYEVKNDIRQWEKIEVGYVRGGVTLRNKPFMVDEDEGYPIIFHDLKL